MMQGQLHTQHKFQNTDLCIGSTGHVQFSGFVRDSAAPMPYDSSLQNLQSKYINRKYA